MIVASRIKEERIKRGLTQEELGNLIGVSKVAISYYERGLEQPKLEKLQKLSDTLNLTPNYILGNDINVVSEDEEAYNIKISKLELEILIQLRKTQKLYNKLCNDPKRTIELIELKLKKEKVI